MRRPVEKSLNNHSDFDLWHFDNMLIVHVINVHVTIKRVAADRLYFLDTKASTISLRMHVKPMLHGKLCK